MTSSARTTKSSPWIYLVTAERPGDIKAPTLVIAGSNDREAMARTEIVRMLIGSNATSVAVPGAAGAPHLTRPEETTACVRGWALGALR
ncbi:MAG: alpha/beta fold hydrolase [Acidimicrobiales bacterium]